MRLRIRSSGIVKFGALIGNGVPLVMVGLSIGNAIREGHFATLRRLKRLLLGFSPSLSMGIYRHVYGCFTTTILYPLSIMRERVKAEHAILALSRLADLGSHCNVSMSTVIREMGSINVVAMRCCGRVFSRHVRRGLVRRN